MLSEHRIHLLVFGIRNCDSCRATLKFLQTRNVPHTFHDFRADGLSAERSAGWLASAHRDQLLNKRPVITDGDKILDIGFSPSSLEDCI